MSNFEFVNFREKQQELFNAIGSMYASVLFLGIQNAMTVQPIVAVERTVFYRERAAGMYSALAYAFAQVSYSICILQRKLLQCIILSYLCFANSIICCSSQLSSFMFLHKL